MTFTCVGWASRYWNLFVTACCHRWPRSSVEGCIPRIPTSGDILRKHFRKNSARIMGTTASGQGKLDGWSPFLKEPHKSCREFPNAADGTVHIGYPPSLKLIPPRSRRRGALRPSQSNGVGGKQ